jgi:acyl phosphate:glycerol-3-phosphate acyltransferase
VPRVPILAALTIARVLAVVAAVVGALAVAYLLGTFPTADLVGAASGRDITAEGSGNPGASNTYRVAGRKAGALVLIGDLIKGALATVFGLAVGGLIDPNGNGARVLAYACGLAAVVGHCWPALRLRKGGRGVASGGGALLVLEPIVTIVSFLSWLAVAKLTRAASLASLGLCLGIPLALLLLDRPWTELVFVLAIAAVIVIRHLPNIRRLRRGEERKLP